MGEFYAGTATTAAIGEAGAYLDPSHVSAVRLPHGRLGRNGRRSVVILIFTNGKKLVFFAQSHMHNAAPAQNAMGE